MFTGIVRELGTVVSRQRAKRFDRLQIHAPATAPGLRVGESVAVNGVCLSVVQVRQGTLTFEIIPETKRLTTLGQLASGDRVNLEPSLTLSDRLNGHLVLGHIDGVGRVVRVRKRAGEIALEIRFDPGLRRYLAPKGPVAVDGVSLTVGTPLASNRLTIFLIPETMRKTTLGLRKAGDGVNLELDYVAKLVSQMVSRR